MVPQLPPVSDMAALKREYSLVPTRDREDAMQEAWLAHLEGKDACRVMKTHAERERRFRKRTVQIESDQETGELSATDRDGTTIKI